MTKMLSMPVCGVEIRKAIVAPRLAPLWRKPTATGITLQDQAALRSAATDRLAWRAVFGSPDEREAARWLLWELGQSTGARPASINDLYLARGRGECICP